MWPNPQFPAIWSHLLKISLMENFIFYEVLVLGLILKNVLNSLKHKTKMHIFLLFVLVWRKYSRNYHYKNKSETHIGNIFFLFNSHQVRIQSKIYTVTIYIYREFYSRLRLRVTALESLTKKNSVSNLTLYSAETPKAYLWR